MLSQADAHTGAHEVIHAMLEAWNQHQPDALAQLFQQDGDLVAADGQQLTGRDPIRTYYEESLNGPYGVLKLRDIALTAVRAVGEDTFLVDATWKVYSPDSADPVALPHATLVLRHRDKGWCILASRVMLPTRVD